MADKFTGTKGEEIQVSRLNPKPVAESGDYNQTKVVTVTDVAANISFATHVVGLMRNLGGQTVYVGGPDVTSSNGMPIPDTNDWSYGKPDLWAICASGITCAVNIYEERPNA